ncbi:MAG: hypothetical protein QXQ28_05770 [Candidatus Nezhaarchaeales archaeon]
MWVETWFTLNEALYALILCVWVFIVVRVISKAVYEVAKGRRGEGSGHYVGVYFARKVIHILAGGLVALVIPMFNLFKTPLLPLALGMAFAVFTYLPHRTGKLMYWFQDPGNIYEVDFCIVWALTMSLGWFLGGGNFWFGVIPVSFMAFGDGVTGIVRNFIFKRRTKHWSGNVAMFLFCAPLGYLLGSNLGPFGGLICVAAALVASIVEHVERIGNYVIDDNITVPLSSLMVLGVLGALLL